MFCDGSVMEWIPGIFLPSVWRRKSVAAKIDSPEPALWCSEMPASIATTEPAKRFPALALGCSKDDVPESEWSARKRNSGAVCRLVQYKHGDTPSLDIMLEGGAGEPIVVSKAKEHGRASKSGVRRGDRLVNVDGSKDFLEHSAVHVQINLRAPTTLVFIGFEGQARSEVRLNNKEVPCGVPSKDNAILRLDSFTICDETVFDPGRASLFFAVPQGRQSWPQQTSMFELRRHEAHRLVHQARCPNEVIPMRPSERRESCVMSGDTAEPFVQSSERAISKQPCDLPRDLAEPVVRRCGPVPRHLLSPTTVHPSIHHTVSKLWAARRSAPKPTDEKAPNASSLPDSKNNLGDSKAAAAGSDARDVVMMAAEGLFHNSFPETSHRSPPAVRYDHKARDAELK